MQKIFKILQPAKLGTLELRNRLVVPPMVTNLANADGTINDALIKYAITRAEGGWGLYILEATYVDKPGKGFSRGLGIDDDNKIEGLSRLTKAMHERGCGVSIQLHHAGRQTRAAITGQPIVAPSVCPVSYSNEPVSELSCADIEDIVRKFAAGARRAKEAGFDAVMLHGAHGYLLQQFLSPYTNKRSDIYGGSLENRLRISLDIINAVRAEVGEKFPVTYRLSVEEGIKGGLSLQEGVKAAAILSKSGIDALHIVAGNYASLQLISAPACYGHVVNKARLCAIREAVGPDFTLAVAGRITNIFQAEELYREGLADFIAMGRASLADPELPLRSARGDYDSVRSCIGCNDGCNGRTSRELVVGCALNPLTGKELEVSQKPKPSEQKKILVIGAGPSGMEAAFIAAKRGHTVTLCERSSNLGGQFHIAAFPPHKEDIFTYLRHMANRLAEAGVTVRLNCNVDAKILQEYKPDHVIMATGGKPIQIPFPGLDSIHSVTAQEALIDKLAELGQRVAIIGGGMVGCETAEFVAASGREVAIIEMQPRIAGDLFVTVRNPLLERLAKHNVAIHTDSKVQAIEDQYILCKNQAGETKKIGPVDSVVMALGVKPAKELENSIRELGIAYTCVGDCEKEGNCLHATQTALAAYEI